MSSKKRPKDCRFKSDHSNNSSTKTSKDYDHKVPSFVAIYNILDALPSNHNHLQMSLARYVINKHNQDHIKPLPHYPAIDSTS